MRITERVSAREWVCWEREFEREREREFEGGRRRS